MTAARADLLQEEAALPGEGSRAMPCKPTHAARQHASRSRSRWSAWARWHFLLPPPPSGERTRNLRATSSPVARWHARLQHARQLVIFGAPDAPSLAEAGGVVVDHGASGGFSCGSSQDGGHGLVLAGA
ncbi:hypothetical protein ZWY2020_030407 [Hordeum vulgare]|nr:hypothetical protein ZWY2020_030407 [Hordeum vulgare]